MLAGNASHLSALARKNMGVREVIASDTLLINQRLAELYDIRGVIGANLREVPVPAQGRRAAAS